MGKWLGIDHGAKRTGLALSDPSGMLALPLKVVEGEGAFWAEVDRLLVEEDLEGVVLGLPRNMDGSLGPRAFEVLALGRQLEARTSLPVECWDERLTTVEAEGVLRRSGAGRRERRERADMLAARILLQSFLDSRRP